MGTLYVFLLEGEDVEERVREGIGDGRTEFVIDEGCETDASIASALAGYHRQTRRGGVFADGPSVVQR